ncbi:hypothetical protein GCM10010359_22180 [Streptomyces morookaense]|nr:hypothetical protein GCM10010359_22180 [Streptomyces morookaense]
MFFLWLGVTLYLTRDTPVQAVFDYCGDTPPTLSPELRPGAGAEPRPVGARGTARPATDGLQPTHHPWGPGRSPGNFDCGRVVVTRAPTRRSRMIQHSPAPLRGGPA